MSGAGTGEPARVGPPPDPRAGRQRFLVVVLRLAVSVSCVFGVAELIAPEGCRRVLGILMVAMLIGAPLVRVLWLVIRWFRRGDLRYGLVGVGLLGVVSLGAVLALLHVH